MKTQEKTSAKLTIEQWLSNESDKLHLKDYELIETHLKGTISEVPILALGIGESWLSKALASCMHKIKIHKQRPNKLQGKERELLLSELAMQVSFELQTVGRHLIDWLKAQIIVCNSHIAAANDGAFDVTIIVSALMIENTRAEAINKMNIFLRGSTRDRAKCHALAERLTAYDAYGLPIQFEITGGEVHDCKIAPEFIAQLPAADFTVADRGYDSADVRQAITHKDSVPVIPRKKNSTIGNAEMDWGLYQYRHLVENLFARLKHFRAIATRFDKLKRNYASVIALICAFLWLPM